MARERGIGVRQRPLPDYYASDLSGYRLVAGPVAGQLSIAGIYNNATDGSILRVYSVAAFCTSTCEVAFETAYGQALPTYTGDVYGSIDPFVGSTWGIPIAGTSAVCLGKHRGGFDLQINLPKEYAPGFCFGLIPPGYSWMMENNVFNNTLEVHIFVLQTRG